MFADERLGAVRAAVADLSWMLSRGYAPVSSLKLVGDRYDLRERQRIAVGRSACGAAALESRLERRAAAADVRGAELLVDGFNVIVSVEAALAGGVILHCADDTYRDLASVHGSYRRVEETRRAVSLIGDMLNAMSPSRTLWLLDRPVSNSGRLAAVLEEEAVCRSADWKVRLVQDPDPILKKADDTVASSDSAILDRCSRWLGLTRNVIDTYIAEAWVIDLRPVDGPSN